MDNNSDDLDIEEFIKEFLDLTQPVLEEDYCQCGIENELPNVPSSGEDSDAHPLVSMRRIKVIEKGIKAGMVKLIFEKLAKFKSAVGFHPPESEIPIHEPVTEADVELFEIRLSALVTKDKARLNELGLLKLKKKGDLRTATLIEDDKELFLRSLRYARVRKHPDTIRFIRQEAARMDPEFFLRLGRILKKPGIDFGHTYLRLQHLLLTFWGIPWNNWEGKVMPPLCCFADPAIAEFARIILKVNHSSVSPGKIKKIWKRLGLRKASPHVIRKFKKQGGKTVFIESGHQTK